MIDFPGQQAMEGPISFADAKKQFQKKFKEKTRVAFNASYRCNGMDAAHQTSYSVVKQGAVAEGQVSLEQGIVDLHVLLPLNMHGNQTVFSHDVIRPMCEVISNAAWCLIAS